MDTLKLVIDGMEVAASEGDSILDAALRADIYIPHLCHHPAIEDIGACRLCVCEVEGEPGVKQTCMTPAAAGMKVTTKTERLDAMRRISMELMLANHMDECTGCLKYLKCELQSLIQYLGVSTSRMRKTLNSVPENVANPLIIRDLNRCVTCGRCVRVCKEVRGVGALDYVINDEARVIVDTPQGKPLMDAGCRFCGACIEICPTGALRDTDGLLKPSPARDMELVPCKHECPAHIDVPRYIRAIKQKDYQQAIAVIREKVPFPLSLGNICMRFCEDSCRRREMDAPLSIRELKRFAAQQDEGLWRQRVNKKPATGKKVAVVGSGPAGLTAAYYLAKCGHSVVVYEKQQVAGGMLGTGIPAYRLPRQTVQNEVDEIIRMGVELRLNAGIESAESLLEQGYDAVLLALGNGQGNVPPIPGADSEGVLSNIAFLREAALGGKPKLGSRVIVLGGGNVAFDCARTAKRLGAEDVMLACIEPRDGMAADDEEVAEAVEEGIAVKNSQSFTLIENDNGRVTGVGFKDVVSFSFNEDKQLVLETDDDSLHIEPADTVIFAIGQYAELPEAMGVETVNGRYIATNGDGITTSLPNIYAAGDAVYGTHSVVKAIAEGRKAAVHIDKQLGGDGDIEDVLADTNEADGHIGEAPEGWRLGRNENALEDAAQRVCGFSEVVHPLTEQQSKDETYRCLECDLRLQIQKSRFWTEYKYK